DLQALQGNRKRASHRLAPHANWSPATRFLAGTVGCGLMANCLAKRTPGAMLLGTLGLGLCVRGVTNLSLNRLTGIGCERRAIDVQKTINIAAPVEQVFEFWSHYENFPRFMSHLADVRDL